MLVKVKPIEGSLAQRCIRYFGPFASGSLIDSMILSTQAGRFGLRVGFFRSRIDDGEGVQAGQRFDRGGVFIGPAVSDVGFGVNEVPIWERVPSGDCQFVGVSFDITLPSGLTPLGSVWLRVRPPEYE